MALKLHFKTEIFLDVECFKKPENIKEISNDETENIKNLHTKNKPEYLNEIVKELELNRKDNFIKVLSLILTIIGIIITIISICH